MWLGMTIVIAADDEAHGPDVDTEEDLQTVIEAMARQDKHNGMSK